jgi:hypothetical protein
MEVYKVTLTLVKLENKQATKYKIKDRICNNAIVYCGIYCGVYFFLYM